jgi:AICAR transformylase/IMP cyclohydrolase PurH
MTQDEKLDEALKGTFPASDAFYLFPDGGESLANDQVRPHPVLGLVENALDA